MNKLIRKSAISIGALIATVLFLVLAIVFSNSVITHAGDGTQSQPGRLLTIHDRGSEKVSLSQAATIGDALKEAGIIVDSKDVVEPAAEVKLVASDYQINIYRARPVMIIDGNIRQKVISPYQTAEQIAKSVGITLYPEDITTIDRVNNITEGTGLQLTIDRATPFVFNLYGKTSTVRTQGMTVGEMLIEKGITLSVDDKVSPNQETAIVEGLAVRVWREGKQTETVDEDVNFEIETIKDANMEIGYHAVRTIGEKGSRSVTYEITIQDGQEVSRVEIASLTTKIPNNQIEVIGAKYKTYGGTCSEWMANAGITDISSASELIRRESNCNPYSVNPTSGACGVGQSLPCSKSGCEMGDGACQTIWMNQYVINRYGSWAAALNFHDAHNWY